MLLSLIIKGDSLAPYDSNFERKMTFDKVRAEVFHIFRIHIKFKSDYIVI